MLFLDINDYELSLRQSNTPVKTQPAAAAVIEGKLTFGRAALLHSRSHPQHFNNKYLYSLAADPISGDLNPAKNHADLIYHHLDQLELPAEEPLVFGVSGQVTNTQLGLLLGICKEAKLDVHGFVDLGLAHALGSVTNRSTHVLDIELHRMTLSEVIVKGSTCSVSQCEAFDGVGVSNIIEGWMNVIADEFVQKTRFDPLHAGHTEQQLFDIVWQWLGDAPSITPRVSIHHGDANRDIELNQNLLISKLEQRLEHIDLDHVGHLLVSPRVNSIPGIVDLIRNKVDHLQIVPENSIEAGYTVLADLLEPNSVRRITAADIDSKHIQADVKTPKTTPKVTQPTHLLLGFVAKSILDPTFVEFIDGETLNSRVASCIINGVAGAGTTLCVGDSVFINGETHTAIRIE